MKNQNILFLIAFFVASFYIETISAQGLFKVIASSGTNIKGGIALKIGSQISGTDAISVGAKSYLGLSYTKGGTVQISVAGSYSAKTLETKLLASQKSVSQKYADFVIGEVSKNGNGDISKNPYKYQGVTGSVERGLYNPVVLLPSNGEFIGDNYLVAWKKYAGEGGESVSYNIRIENEFGEVALKTSTKDLSYKFEPNAKELAEFDMLKVIVEGVGANGKVIRPSIGFKIGEYVFNRPDQETKTKLIAKYNAFKESVGTEQDANTAIQEATFFEENGLIADAFNSYKKAMTLEPSNEIFTIAYTQFLIRYKIGDVDQYIKAENK